MQIDEKTSDIYRAFVNLITLLIEQLDAEDE